MIRKIEKNMNNFNELQYNIISNILIKIKKDSRQSSTWFEENCSMIL